MTNTRRQPINMGRKSISVFPLPNLCLLLHPKHQQIARQRRDIAHNSRHDDDATDGYPNSAFDSSESVVL